MKKLLFLFLLFLFSCVKDEPLFCWQCKTIVVDFNSGIIDNWNQKICNRPEEDIRRFEREQNYIVDDMRIITICEKIK